VCTIINPSFNKVIDPLISSPNDNGDSVLLVNFEYPLKNSYYFYTLLLLKSRFYIYCLDDVLLPKEKRPKPKTKDEFFTLDISNIPTEISYQKSRSQPLEDPFQKFVIEIMCLLAHSLSLLFTSFPYAGLYYIGGTIDNSEFGGIKDVYSEKDVYPLFSVQLYSTDRKYFDLLLSGLSFKIEPYQKPPQRQVDVSVSPTISTSLSTNKKNRIEKRLQRKIMVAEIDEFKIVTNQIEKDQEGVKILTLKHALLNIITSILQSKEVGKTGDKERRSGKEKIINELIRSKVVKNLVVSLDKFFKFLDSTSSDKRLVRV
jgi:hypothetical protein